LPNLRREHAEHVQRGRMIGLLGEHVAIERLGFAQLPRLVKRDRLLHRIGHWP
jgi:hypothetical protein